MAETKKKYELVDTTADIGVKVGGKTLAELFEACAEAMFDIISDTDRVEPMKKFNLKAEEKELDMLLVEFLNGLLYYKDTENMVFSMCRVKSVRKNGNFYRLEADAHGEPFDQGRHVVGKDVKAATYHRLEINEKEGYAIVIFDI